MQISPGKVNLFVSRRPMCERSGWKIASLEKLKNFNWIRRTCQRKCFRRKRLASCSLKSFTRKETHHEMGESSCGPGWELSWLQEFWSIRKCPSQLDMTLSIKKGIEACLSCLTWKRLTPWPARNSNWKLLTRVDCRRAIWLTFANHQIASIRRQTLNFFTFWCLGFCRV